MSTRRTSTGAITPAYCRALLLAVSFAIVPLSCPAEIFRWIDESGAVHYGDRIPIASHATAVTALSIHSRVTERPIDPVVPPTAADDEPARRYAAPPPVRVAANASGMYWVDGTVNGQTLQFIVDTGANLVTLSRKHATALGLEIPEPGQSQLTAKTASGEAAVFHVRLEEVRVGDVVVHGALAAITDNDFYPESPLLGMSFLSQAQLLQRENVLEIRRP